jgi:hypothetical protein
MAIGISALIGAALGLRLNVFVLIPTIILAGFATAVIQVAKRAPSLVGSLYSRIGRHDTSN